MLSYQGGELMKVVVICLDMDPGSIQGDIHTGAAHLYVKETLEMLNHYGVQALAFTRHDEIKKKTKETIGSNVVLYRIQVGMVDKQPKEFLWGKEQIVYNQITEILDDLEFVPDIVHGVYWYSGVVALHLSNRYQAPFIYTVISLGKVKHRLQSSILDHDLAREKSEEYILQNASAVISVSQQEKNNLLDLYSEINKDKVFVIGRGLDTNLFTNKTNHHDGILQKELLSQGHSGAILFAGRLIWSKGYSFLFDIYDNLLRDISFHAPPLWIVGGTPDEINNAKQNSNYTDLLREAEKIGRIQWWGIVPREIMPSYYRNSICTCLPSLYDPAARVVLESMACETPVIMTPTGYADEVVKTGVNGYVTNHGDKFLWINYIKALASDAVWKKILGLQARATVYPHFAMNEFWKRQYKVYLWVKSTSNDLIPEISIKTPSLYPHWIVPNSNNSDEVKVLDEISLICKEKIGDGQIVREDYLENGFASSQIYSWVTTTNNKYTVKVPVDKKNFYRIFWTTHGADVYLAAKSRYCAEKFFGARDFFIPALFTVDEKMMLVYPGAEKVQEIGLEHFLELVSSLRAFHQSSIISNIIDLPYSSMITFDFLSTYDQKLMQLNSAHRDKGLWFSPAELYVELNRALLGIEHGAWGYSQDLEKFKFHASTLLDNINSLRQPLGFIWGECRPDHIYIYKNRVCGIDPESCSVGEAERDTGEFLWWMLDLRNKNLTESDYCLVRNMLANILPLSEKWRILGWIWLTNFSFYLWDVRRGRPDRINRFIKFNARFGEMIQEVVG